jgi:acyl carrier protein
MSIQDFINNFAFQFDETDVAVFTPETEFKELDEYSSLVALSLIAMIDDEYDVTLKGDDIRNSKTIQDLFNIVKSKL